MAAAPRRNGPSAVALSMDHAARVSVLSDIATLRAQYSVCVSSSTRSQVECVGRSRIGRNRYRTPHNRVAWSDLGLVARFAGIRR